jgi:hypothetical protein
MYHIDILIFVPSFPAEYESVRRHKIRVHFTNAVNRRAFMRVNEPQTRHVIRLLTATEMPDEEHVLLRLLLRLQLYGKHQLSLPDS